MSHIDLILPVCAFALTVVLILRVKVLVLDMISAEEEFAHPLRAAVRLVALALAACCAALLAGAAIWLIAIIYHSLTAS